MADYERFECTVDMEEYIRECVDIDTFVKLCQECTNYGNRWSCPPYEFSPLDFWKEYKAFRIIGYKYYTDQNLSIEENLEKLAEIKDEMQEELMALEAENPESMMLAAGTCYLCKECSKPDGKPCRQPDKMRYSIESLGGNVGKTAKKYLNLNIKWITSGKIPEYLLRVGGLLLK